MTIRIRYFASLREALGPGEEVEASEGLSLGALRNQLAARGGPHATVLAGARPVRCALNQTLVPESSPVADGDEVAFFPPVTGG